MLIRELLASIGSAELPPVLLFVPGKPPFDREGWEPYLVEQAIQQLTDAFVDPSLRDMAYTAFYADEAAPGDIALEAQTLPFLAERRVVLVRNVDRYMLMGADRLAPLLQYLESPNESTLLLLVSPAADKRKKLYKLCEKLGGVVECPQLNDRDLEHWIRTEIERQGKRVHGEAVQEIVHRAGARLGDVSNAINLVVTYVGDAELVREEDVVAACADVAEESVWALTDAIAASDTHKALDALYQLLDLGKHPDELMGLINWLLESAYRAAPDTAAELRSKFVQKKVTPLARKLGTEKLKAAFALCTDTHFMIRSTGVDEVLALELLVIKLSARRRRAARR